MVLVDDGDNIIYESHTHTHTYRVSLMFHRFIRFDSLLVCVCQTFLYLAIYLVWNFSNFFFLLESNRTCVSGLFH